MAFRLYIVPAIGSGLSPEDPRRPKYIAALNPPGGEWWDYGFQPVFFCGVDLLPADDAAVVANNDVISFPFNLATTISGGTVNQVKSALEALFVPADYISGGSSWHEIAQSNAGMFRYMRRLHGILGNTILFDGTGNKTLNTQYQNIPVNVQNAIQQAAALDGFSTAFITPTTQVRTLFKNLADQSQALGLTIGGHPI